MMTVKDDEELLPVGIDDEDALMFTLTTLLRDNLRACI
jgi:hypothetical protein